MQNATSFPCLLLIKYVSLNRMLLIYSATIRLKLLCYYKSKFNNWESLIDPYNIHIFITDFNTLTFSVVFTNNLRQCLQVIKRF